MERVLLQLNFKTTLVLSWFAPFFVLLLILVRFFLLYVRFVQLYVCSSVKFWFVLSVCLFCPVIPNLCLGCPTFDSFVIFYSVCLFCPVLHVLFYMSCFTCPVLNVLFYIPIVHVFCPFFPVCTSFFWISKCSNHIIKQYTIQCHL